MMLRRILFALALCAFIAYAALIAPPDDADLTRALVRGAFTGNFGNIDPGISAVFSSLGIVPLLFLVFLVRDGTQERVPAWPFALAAFAVGGFAILPYLVLRSGGAHRTPAAPGRVRRLLASRIVGWILLIALVAVLGGGLSRCNMHGFAVAFATKKIVNVMTLDLGLCSLLLVYLADQIARRDAELKETPLLRMIRWIPLLGPFCWNALVKRSA
jgi:hypothetical protein